MCFFVAQFAKLAQIRMRYWNSVNQNTNAFSEKFIANGFTHPNLLVLSEVDSTITDNKDVLDFLTLIENYLHKIVELINIKYNLIEYLKINNDA